MMEWVMSLVVSIWEWLSFHPNDDSGRPNSSHSRLAGHTDKVGRAARGDPTCFGGVD